MSVAEIRVGLRRAAPAAAVRRAAAAMRRDGALALDGLFDAAHVRRMRDWVLRRYGDGTLARRGPVRDIAGRFTAAIPFEGPFLEPAFYAPPALSGILDAVLGADRRISSFEVVLARPGAYEQHQHVDATIRFDVGSGRGRRAYAGDLSDLPAFSVALAVPLCAVTEENGPTAVWAGSQREAMRPVPRSEAAIRRLFREEHLVGPLGRAFLFDYSVFHCGMPNDTREDRPVLMLVFCRPWFRDHNVGEIEPQIAIAPRALARVPEAHRPLFALSPHTRRKIWAPRP